MRTDAEIVAGHIARLIREQEPLLVVGVEAVRDKTVALTGESLDGRQTYRREYDTDGPYTSIDRDAPQKILNAFKRHAAHAFGTGGPLTPEKEGTDG
jgi:hypothetical protein